MPVHPSSAFPKLGLVEGRGFDHEIVQLDGELQHPLARVYGDDEGLRLARLFTIAPQMLRALQMCLGALEAAQPHVRYADMFAIGAANEMQDAMDAARDAIEWAMVRPRRVASRAPDGGD